MTNRPPKINRELEDFAVAVAVLVEERRRTLRDDRLTYREMIGALQGCVNALLSEMQERAFDLPIEPPEILDDDEDDEPTPQPAPLTIPPSTQT